ncbi:MAG: hypothetical protein H6782_03100 [Candidatus Nomurabacteria bacterium]|nr:MAG: hypothetical protein H6782_03100 [Candidatus Nomurabacteria bacterium]
MNKNFKFLIVAVLLLLITPKFSEASTQTIIVYAGSGDGQVGIGETENQTTWSDARSYEGIVTYTLQDTENTNSARSDVVSGSYRLYRGSIPFDTSVIPDDAEIENVTLNLYGQGNNGSQGGAKACITSHVRQDIADIVGSDYHIDNFGTIEFSVPSILTSNQYTTFHLNNAGISNINLSGNSVFGVRTNYDCDDTDPGSGVKAVNWYSSEYEGNDFDPYLEIEYTIPDTEDEYPLYTQIESPYPSLAETAGWADDTYASGDAYCGGTIAKCGCAITSLVMMARANGITKGVDDSDVNPGNFNSWLIDNKGYTHGAVNWTTALQYFGTENEDETINVPIKLSKHNQSSTTLIKASASSEGEYVVGFSTKVPGGHYFVISDYIEDDYIVRDPWYYNTKTLDDVVSSTSVKVKDYDNVINKANIFSLNDPKVLTGVIEIALASPAELRLEDKDEKITGYDSGGVVANIPSSSYDQNESIGDPDDPEAGLNTHYVKRLMVLEASEKYGLEVVGLDTGPYTLGITVFDVAGHHHYFEYKGVTYEGKVDRFVIDVETGEIRPKGDDEDDENDDDDDEEDDDGDRDRGDKDKRHHKLLKKWLGKIERELQKGKYRQAKAHVRTFHKLLKAKKVDGDYWHSALHEILSDYEIEKKGERYDERGKSRRDD